METQKKMMLLNPIASAVYGLWFVLWPRGYMQVVEQAQGEIPANLTATFVSFGAALLSLAIVQWVLRQQTTEATCETNMTVFGAVWGIIGVGVLIGALGHPSETRSATLPVIQGALFLAIAVLFYAQRKPKAEARAA